MVNRSNSIFFLLISISFCADIQTSNSRITLSNISEQELDLGFSSADYNFTSPFEIRIDSNNEWDLYIQPSDLNLISLYSQIPIQKIQWKKSTDHDAAYRPLNYEKIWVGSSQQYKNGLIELNFRLMLNWTTHPGEYSLPIEFILEDKPSISNKRRKKIR